MEDQYAEMEQLLYAWNLPQLCEIFREQEITPDALDALTDEDIVTLIPKLGPRALFRKRLSEWLKSAQPPAADNNLTTQAQQIQQNLVTAVENENDVSYAYVDEDNNDVEVLSELWQSEDMSTGDANIDGDDYEQANQIEAVEQNEHFELYDDGDAVEIAENVVIMEEQQNLGDISQNESPPEHQKPVEDVANLSKNNFKTRKSARLKIDGIKVEASTMETPKSNINENQTIAIKREAEAEENIDVENVETTAKRRCQRIGNNWAGLNVEELLLSTVRGRSLIENYESNPNLDKRARCYLADIIITEAFDKNLIMDRFKFEHIANQIVQLFPTEEKNSWYIQHKSKKCSGGTLYYKYYAVYTKMRRTGFYQHYMENVSKTFNSDESLSSEIEKNNYSVKLADLGDDPEKIAFKRSIPRYERIRHSKDFQRIDVRHVLGNCYEGLGIIDFYKHKSMLDVTTRNRLCKLVCMEGIKKNMKMQPVDFYDISCQIVDFFPNEKHEVYFFPRGKTPPKGCLYHKYIYLIRRIKKTGLTKKSTDSGDV